MATYKDLIAWKKGIEIIKEIYIITSLLPDTEKYTLKSQINRAAISIPSNIAEGWGRENTKSFLHFLRIARGSLYELETQIIIVNELSLINTENLKHICDLIEEEIRILNGLIKSLSKKELESSKKNNS